LYETLSFNMKCRISVNDLCHFNSVLLRAHVRYIEVCTSWKHEVIKIWSDVWVLACYKFWPLCRGVFVSITKYDLSQKRHFV
jgi:hypothetical protein